MIRNPILPGFNPDPSICRVGGDYYIATSTFEWYPGVQLHHSTDLVNWRLVGRALDRASQLDMRGNPDSGGIWAPCLSHADGLFWLVYTDVKRIDGGFKDTHNYIVTAPSIEGPWSEPAYVNSSGFDPSLFHDDDGRKWFLNMVWNHVSSGVGGQPKHPSFAGILMQEWDPGARTLLGEPRTIFHGSPHGLVEGPHLFRRDGWYYLTTAEGGTGYDHAVTMARSRAIDGPYELHPLVHVITSKDAPEATLQRAGHGQVVETPGARSITRIWRRGRFRASGVRRSAVRPPSRNASGRRMAGSIWNRAGRCRMSRCRRRGGRPCASAGRRDRPFRRRHAAARLPAAAHAGLAAPVLADRASRPSVSLRARIDRKLVRAGAGRAPAGRVRLPRRDQRRVRPGEFPAGRGHRPLLQPPQVPLSRADARPACRPRAHRHELSGRLARCAPAIPARRARSGARRRAGRARHGGAGASLCFYHRRGDAWRQTGPVLDAGVISDEGGRGEHGSFTGAFVGMAAFDTSGAGLRADFDHFTYRRL